MNVQTINFTECTISLLEAITNKMRFYGMLNNNPSSVTYLPPSTLMFPVITKDYRFCYDSIELVKKTMNRLGFDIELCKYSTIKDNNKKGELKFSYEFKLKKKK